MILSHFFSRLFPTFFSYYFLFFLLYFPFTQNDKFPRICLTAMVGTFQGLRQFDGLHKAKGKQENKTKIHPTKDKKEKNELK